jgi:hypothetical protein
VTPNSIAAACELAGFFAAHTAWSLADGETPSAITALQRTDGTRAMQRLVGDDPAERVQAAQAWLADGPANAAAAVLIYMGEVARADGRDDAIIVEWASYGDRDNHATHAVPYRAEPFALGPIRTLAHSPRVDVPAAVQAFERGVRQHAKATVAWATATALWA